MYTILRMKDLSFFITVQNAYRLRDEDASEDIDKLKPGGRPEQGYFLQDFKGEALKRRPTTKPTRYR